MGYFDFMDEEPRPDTADQDLETLPKAKKAQQGSAPQKTVGTAPTSKDVDPEQSFMVERAKAADFALKQAEKAIDRMTALYEGTANKGAYSDEYKTQLRDHKVGPENYARELERIAASFSARTGAAINPSSLLRDVEEAVMAYKRLQVRPEAQTIQSKMSSQDVESLNKGIETRQAQLKEIDEKLKFSASERQRQELMQQRQAVEGGILDASKRRNQISPATPQEQAGAEALKTMPDSETPVKDFYNALGVKPEQMSDNVRKAFQALGISPENWNDRVPMEAGLRRVMDVMDPDHTIAARIAREAAEAQAGDAAATQAAPQESKGQPSSGTSGQSSYNQQRISDKETQIRQLYGQMGQSPFMQSWVGIVLFVLTSLMVGPRQAALLMGVGRNRNAIQGEIRQLEYDIRRLERRDDFEMRKELEARKEAARQTQRVEDKDFAIRKMWTNHQLILERAIAKGDKEKPIIDKLEKDYRRYFVAAKDEWSKAIDEFTGEVRDPAAMQRYKFFTKRADEIDKLLWQDSEENQQLYKQEAKP